jgi:hypothetical protein
VILAASLSRPLPSPVRYGGNVTATSFSASGCDVIGVFKKVPDAFCPLSDLSSKLLENIRVPVFLRRRSVDNAARQ